MNVSDILSHSSSLFGVMGSIVLKLGYVYSFKVDWELFFLDAKEVLDHFSNAAMMNKILGAYFHRFHALLNGSPELKGNLPLESGGGMKAMLSTLLTSGQHIKLQLRTLDLHT
ncbi:unnamed protein product [Rhizoctonia solani]|uniref:Uncharacterized protein n=1 Tax=Rhizoctonia solani TaxID=456999 RepID=A0A8H3GBH2_9AGAM|nr:unnamed protein product [Rhizoctonia solani]